MKNILKIIGISVLVSACANNFNSSDLEVTRALLLEQLKNTHTNQDWFVPAKTAMEGLTAEQAHWKGSTENHSIAQLVSHLTFWNEMSLKAFKGDSIPDFMGENEETFEIYTETDWKTTVRKLDSVQNEWEKLVADASGEKLLEWNKELGNMSSHMAYHTGQMVYIRKRNGWWK